MKYPVLCACVHSLIQSSCLVCTISVFTARTKFNEQAASMAKLHAPSAEDSFRFLEVELPANFSGELRNGALPIWRGVVCFSRDFTFRINILNSISTPHEHSFFIITNVLSVSCDLPRPFLTFYFNPNLHHFINNTFL